MKKILIAFAIASTVMLTSTYSAAAPSVMSPQYWKTQALNDLIPFWEKTKDVEYGGFYTNVNEDGTIGEPGNKYTRMISRATFGFCAAYLLSGEDKYLDFAGYGFDYMLQFCWDAESGGWHTTVDEAGDTDDGDKNLFDETYGNLGPVLLYFTTGDAKALECVQKTHEMMQTKAWDKEYGGYYASVGNNWETVTTNKSFNAELDTCTAYLLYYYLATKDKALLADIMAVGDIITAHMVDPKTGFVGESFTRTWEPTESRLWAGHNLKTGWVLARMYCLTGEKKYLETAEKIAGSQIKYMWDEKYGGWFFRFQSDDPADRDDDKDWWTQEEGNNLMVTLCHATGAKKYMEKFKQGAQFWDNYLIDKKYGECYNAVSRKGAPLRRKKADMYKSAYHSMEQALLNYLYLSLYVDKKEAQLYFRLSSDKAGQKHYVNLLEDPAVVIKSVELDGKPFADFNAGEGYLTLPEGKAMKFRVTYGIAE
ncbi:MAG: AGE family epimerase/isomerase [Spirochaetia bacterium]|nr:AGE family epimerase/isomerase [Spirochaetia bacterium]